MASNSVLEVLLYVRIGCILHREDSAICKLGQLLVRIAHNLRSLLLSFSQPPLPLQRMEQSILTESLMRHGAWILSIPRTGRSL